MPDNPHHGATDFPSWWEARGTVVQNFPRKRSKQLRFSIGNSKKKGVTDRESKLFCICAWKGDGGQIDLLIDRRDQVINLCEMKFSRSEFEITKQYDGHLRDRAEIFRSATKTRKALHQTFVTTYGVK